MTAEAPYSVTLNASAPPGPDYVLEVAQAFAECVRVMNHATRDHAALEYPHEGDQFLRYLESAVSRLPQLLDQIASWYEREAADGKLTVAGGDWEGMPGMAVVALRMRMDAARVEAEQLAADLGSAARVTTDLAAAGDGSEESES